MRKPTVTVRQGETTKAPTKPTTPATPPRSAMGKDPKKPAKKEEKKKPSAWTEIKNRLLQMDPNDPAFPDQINKLRKEGRARKFGENVINAFIVKAQKKTPVLPETPTQIGEAPGRMGGEAYEDIIKRFREFDPYKMQEQYQAAFGTEMDRARQNVLSQFERRNAEQFGRERQSTEQAIIERGLDPNAPAAQAMMRDLNDRQDRARQEAQSAAEQAAYAVQQQGYEQAYRTGMMPYEQFQAVQQPYMGYLQSQYARDLAQMGQTFDLEKLAKQYEYQKKLGGGGGGGGNSSTDRQLAEYLMRQYPPGGQQQPQQTAGQSATQGFAQGVSLGVANR